MGMGTLWLCHSTSISAFSTILCYTRVIQFTFEVGRSYNNPIFTGVTIKVLESSSHTGESHRGESSNHVSGRLYKSVYKHQRHFYIHDHFNGVMESEVVGNACLKRGKM